MLRDGSRSKKQKVPVTNIPEDAPVTQTVEVVTTPTVAQPINLTIEEVLLVEMDV